MKKPPFTKVLLLYTSMITFVSAKPGQGNAKKAAASSTPLGTCLPSMCGSASSSSSNPPDDGACTEENVDILIIGAGLAGLGSAREIEIYNRNNPDDQVSYKLIEADDTVGGRMKGANWIHGGEGNPIAEMLFEQKHRNASRDELKYDTQKWDDVKHFELTSNGAKAVKKNDVNSAKREFRFLYDCVTQFATYYYYDVTACEEQLSQGISCELPDDISLGGAIQVCYGDYDGLAFDPYQHDYDLTRMFKAFEYEFAQHPEVTSLNGLPEDTYDVNQMKDWFIRDDRRLVSIAETEYEDYCISPCICLERKVTEIKWSVTPLEVSTEAYPGGGTPKTFTAKQVISTVSSGVLAQEDLTQGISLFNPALSTVETPLGCSSTGSTDQWTSDKLNDMQAVFTLDIQEGSSGERSMPLYYELAFQFSDSEWAYFEDNDYEFIYVDFNGNYEGPSGPGCTSNCASDPRGKCRVWQNLDTKWSNEFFHGSNVLVCTLTTEDIEELQVFGEFGNPNSDLNKLVTDLFRESLGRVYGDMIKNLANCERCMPWGCESTSGAKFDLSGTSLPQPGNCRYRFFDQKNDDLWKGSYENWNIGGTWEQFRNFIAPLPDADNPSVHFAGSATCFNYWGFMHGALYSGIRAGNKALEALGVQGTLPNSPQFCEGDPHPGIGAKRVPSGFP